MANNKPLTDQQFLSLCQFSYISIEEDEGLPRFEDIFVEGKRLGEIVLILYINNNIHYEYMAGFNRCGFKGFLMKILKDERLSRLEFMGYENDNIDLETNPYGTGFVGMAFRDPVTDDCYLNFTGSEGGRETEEEGIPVGFLTVDWMDNYGFGTINKSPQFLMVEEFIQAIVGECSGNIYTTGHSKGGANAIYGAAAFDGVTGVAFDAPGIGQCLTRKQITRLKRSNAINYLAEGDIVGPLLFHYEKIRYVDTVLDEGITLYKQDENGGMVPFESRHSNPTHHHYPQAIYFDKNGYVRSGKRTKWSIITEDVIKGFYLFNLMTGTPITTFYMELKDYLELYKGNVTKEEISKFMKKRGLTTFSILFSKLGKLTISQALEIYRFVKRENERQDSITIKEAIPLAN